MATGPAHRVSVGRASARTPVPWHNGAGTTTVVAASSSGSSSTPDEPLWRVSIATIERDAPFSFFAGVDRALMPLSAEGLRLSMDGVVRTVARHEVTTFAGEAQVESVDVARTGFDLNLMTWRGRATGRLEMCAVPGEFVATAGEVVVAVAVSGEVRLGHEVLGELDAVEVTGPVRVRAAGRGALALARIAVVDWAMRAERGLDRSVDVSTLAARRTPAGPGR